MLVNLEQSEVDAPLNNMEIWSFRSVKIKKRKGTHSKISPEMPKKKEN